MLSTPESKRDSRAGHHSRCRRGPAALSSGPSPGFRGGACGWSVCTAVASSWSRRAQSSGRMSFEEAARKCGAASRAAISASTRERGEERRDGGVLPELRRARRPPCARSPPRTGLGLISTLIIVPRDCRSRAASSNVGSRSSRKPSECHRPHRGSRARPCVVAGAPVAVGRARQRRIWSRKAMPSFESFTSISWQRYPSDCPRRIAPRVFSGASVPPPRWATSPGYGQGFHASPNPLCATTITMTKTT
jgi:hypothetical protein